MKEAWHSLNLVSPTLVLTFGSEVVARVWLEVVRDCNEAGESLRVVTGESSKMVALTISSNAVSKVLWLGRDWLTFVSRG
jgi:hypothetical protein